MKILIIADIHANYRALTAVLETFSDADEVWCLGDIVEIGPCPVECIRLVRESCRYVVQGNHDASFVAFDPDKAHPEWNGWEHQQANTEQLDYLRNLPTCLSATCDGAVYMLVHGSPQDHLCGTLHPRTDPADLRHAAAACEDGVISGHTHVAMVMNIDGKWIVNAGTIGQPRDGDYRAQCLILQDGVFSYHLVDYDLDAMEEDYRRSSLPDFVKEEWTRNTRTGIVEQHGLQLGPFSKAR